MSSFSVVIRGIFFTKRFNFRIYDWFFYCIGCNRILTDYQKLNQAVDNWAIDNFPEMGNWYKKFMSLSVFFIFNFFPRKLLYRIPLNWKVREYISVSWFFYFLFFSSETDIILEYISFRVYQFLSTRRGSENPEKSLT